MYHNIFFLSLSSNFQATMTTNYSKNFLSFFLSPPPANPFQKSASRPRGYYLDLSGKPSLSRWIRFPHSPSIHQSSTHGIHRNIFIGGTLVRNIESSMYTFEATTGDAGSLIHLIHHQFHYIYIYIYTLSFLPTIVFELRWYLEIRVA